MNWIEQLEEHWLIGVVIGGVLYGMVHRPETDKTEQQPIVIKLSNGTGKQFSDLHNRVAELEALVEQLQAQNTQLIQEQGIHDVIDFGTWSATTDTNIA